MQLGGDGNFGPLLFGVNGSFPLLMMGPVRGGILAFLIGVKPGLPLLTGANPVGGILAFVIGAKIGPLLVGPDPVGS